MNYIDDLNLMSCEINDMRYNFHLKLRKFQLKIFINKYKQNFLLVILWQIVINVVKDLKEMLSFV